MLLLVHKTSLRKVIEKLAGFYINKRHVIFLQGPLGAGKTTFARAWLRALGVDENIPSPSYAIVQTYQNRQGGMWHHFDCYRLRGAEDLLNMGIEDYLHDSILCEWPEHGMDEIMQPDIRIELAFSEEEDVRVCKVIIGNDQDNKQVRSLLNAYIKKDQQ